MSRKFIKLTDAGGKPRLINLDAIEDIQPALDGSAVITYRSNSDGYVRMLESCESVIASLTALTVVV